MYINKVNEFKKEKLLIPRLSKIYGVYEREVYGGVDRKVFFGGRKTVEIWWCVKLLLHIYRRFRQFSLTHIIF